MCAVVTTQRVPGSARLTEIPDPTQRQDEVVVDVLRVGVDGTDAEITAGHYGEAPPGGDYRS